MKKNELYDYLRSFVRTITWLLLLVVFTYTPILVEFLSNSPNCLAVYYEIQQTNIALFVNIGILGMVVIDYFAVKPSINGRKVFILFVGILSIFIVNVHSGIMFEKRNEAFACVINNNYLSIVAHFLFLIIAGYFKFLSLKKPKDSLSYVVTEIK